MEGADLLKTGITVEIFGEEKLLRPNFKTIRAFEEVMNGSVVDVARFWNPPRITALAALLWAALGGRDSKKSLEQVADELDGPLNLKIMELAILISEHYGRDAKKKGVAE